jgi:hypothetical protein
LAKFDINSYARRGAQIRISELTDELESIYTAFPDLRSGRPGRRGGRRPQNAVGTTGTGGATTGGATAGRRRRRGMTAAQRKAVSARMKRYWADRRKGKEK